MFEDDDDLLPEPTAADLARRPIKPPPPVPPWSLWLTLLIVLVGLAFRLREAGRSPLWVDEIFTLWVARLSVPDLLRSLAQDMHPPLYFLTAAFWRLGGGESPMWLRTLPILTGMAVLGATYLLTRAFFNRGAALLAVAFVALHPSAIYFSQELRSYGLLWLLILLFTWFAWLWFRNPSRLFAAGFALAAAGGLYTHYFGGVVLAIVAVWGLIQLRGQPGRLRTWLLLLGAVALLFLPQLPVFLEQVRRNRDHWVQAQGLRGLVDYASALSFDALKSVPLLLGLAFLPLFRRADCRGAGLLLLLIFAPVLLAWVVTERGGHLFVVRYLVYGVPAFCALVAAGIMGFSARPARVALGTAVVLLGLYTSWRMPEPAEGNALRRVTQTLLARIQPGDTIYCADSHSYAFLAEYARGRAPLRFLLSGTTVPYYELGNWIPPENRSTAADFLAAIATSDHAWWGVRTRHGGQSTNPARELIERNAAEKVAEDGPVMLWRGGGGAPTR